MLRHTHIALLALFALASAMLQAQEPVYGLLPNESEITSEVMPAAETPTAMGQTVSAQLSAETDYGMPGQYVGPYDSGPYDGGPYDGGAGGCASCGNSGSYGAGSYGDLGCSSCGGGKAFGCASGCCCPPWRVRSKMVVMSRESNDNTALVLQDVAFAGGALANSRVLLGAGQVDFDWEAGFDVSLSQADMYGNEIEGRFFHLNEFNDRFTRTGNNVELNNLILANGVQPLITLNPRTNPVTAVANYESQFDTVELNYREPFAPWWTVTAGFRYVMLEEKLGLFTADAAAPALRSRTTYLADNDMYGFQLGSEVILASNSAGWEIRGTARLGIYYNDLKTEARSSGNGFVNGQGYNRTGQTAWLGEFGLNAIYHVNCSTSFNFGYSLISIDGVGLATEQVTAVVNPLQGPDLGVGHNEGTAFYHGFNAGIEIRW